MTYKFTKKSENAIENAENVAIKLGHNYVGTEHLLYGLATEKEGVAGKILVKNNITPEIILEKIEELIGIGNSKSKKTIGLTPRTKKVIENAFQEAKNIDSEYIGTEQLLIGILKETDSIAVRIILDLKIEIQKIYSEIKKITNEYQKPEPDILNEKQNQVSNKETPTLNQYGNDLTFLAIKGKLDPVIGRKKETDRIIQILLRRTKNNPCLIGEPRSWKNISNRRTCTRNCKGKCPRKLKKQKSCHIRYFRNGRRCKIQRRF